MKALAKVTLSVSLSNSGGVILGPTEYLAGGDTITVVEKPL